MLYSKQRALASINLDILCTLTSCSKGVVQYREPKPTMEIATGDQVTLFRSGDETCKNKGQKKAGSESLIQQLSTPMPQGDPVISAATPDPQRLAEGFRHSSKERKDIKRGQHQLRAATGHDEIRGSSTGSHQVSTSSQGNSAPYLIYVG